LEVIIQEGFQNIEVITSNRDTSTIKPIENLI